MSAGPLKGCPACPMPIPLDMAFCGDCYKKLTRRERDELRLTSPSERRRLIVRLARGIRATR